jgi:hypothetical protein
MCRNRRRFVLTEQSTSKRSAVISSARPQVDVLALIHEVPNALICRLGDVETVHVGPGTK